MGDENNPQSPTVTVTNSGQQSAQQTVSPKGGGEGGGQAVQPQPPPPQQPMVVVVQPQPQQQQLPMPVGQRFKTVTPELGPDPVPLTCGHCDALVLTETRPAPGLLAYVLGTCICILGFWCGCCLIPCMLEMTQDVEHRCPNCRTYLGRYRRIG
ncbi:lipopolysaccharide-induced tumor necrosis factor-alpha factor homolog [Oppia nitens]|uniref:lipopolysaccharide-induced tumor necrosis factor-alpha factor homolog n=1 Tax=Oppia nitens TaxID=1686743 RepID=UPI0023DCA866|nr:lipopolysaccharide-induced tumor necrosis factor-alpha factor homolog [Oppia nitens]